MCRKQDFWATNIGSYWAIPEDENKPVYNMIKTGKYIKGNNNG